MQIQTSLAKHAAVLTLAIVVGLWVDQHFDWWGQLATNVAIWILYLWYVHHARGNERVSLLACLCYATAGELFCSLVWGLYEYRLHNVPMFVPPGHCLLFMLGTLCAPRLPRAMLWMVPAAAVLYAGSAAYLRLDTQGLLYVGLFLFCMVFGSNKRLYASMFVLSLALELYGTWLGNWRWAPIAPWTGLSSQNPPVCAGAFYCALDALVMLTLRRFTKKIRQPAQLIPDPVQIVN